MLQQRGASMSAASSLSLISPLRVAPAIACYNGANYATLAAGRKYEILNPTQCRPVADMQAKGPRKTTAIEKKQNLASSRSQGKSWPSESVTADTREPSKGLASKETVSSSEQKFEPSDGSFTSALLQNTPSKDQHHLKEENSVVVSDQEISPFVDKETDPVILNNREELGPFTVNSTAPQNNTGTKVVENVEASLVPQEPKFTENVEDSLAPQETIFAAPTCLDGKDSREVEGPKAENSQSESMLLPYVDDIPNDQISTSHDDSELEVESQVLQVKSLSEKAALDGGKLFFYPQSLKAGSEAELFLNRAASTLSQQPNVKVRGAYNDWRWKSFETELIKTDLPGDWWSCKLQVPKEAYKLDFVFHNGGSVYENNLNKDFHVLLEDGMSREAFESFLIDEEWKEIKRIAAEKALEEKRIAEERRLLEKKALEEADRQEAIRQTKEQREKISRIMRKAVKHVEGLWYFQPSEFEGGETVKLFYNRSYRNLGFSKEVWIHGGYNNWQDSLSIVGQLTFYSDQGGHWWTIDVDVPKQAFVLDWVFADGPPEAASLYDNNTYQDFHALVPRGVPNDLYWRNFEDQIFATLQQERERREEAARRKAQRTADMKAKFKEKTKSILLKSREHIFYTSPVDVEAGKEVTIFYNPSHTVLNGKPEVWLLASFNRWMHRQGNLPLVKMLPVINSPFHKATVKVPLDAYMMDFVFSDRGGEGEGTFDNNHGIDYHVPVVGGSTREPPMKVVHISVEMAPIAKVGGLGDVVTSLSRAVQDLGHSVEVVLPKYDCLNYKDISNLQEKEEFPWGGTQIKVWNGTVEGLPVVFLEPQNG